jgi:hypothetical protein
LHRARGVFQRGHKTFARLRHQGLVDFAQRAVPQARQLLARGLEDFLTSGLQFGHVHQGAAFEQACNCSLDSTC